MSPSLSSKNHIGLPVWVCHIGLPVCISTIGFVTFLRHVACTDPSSFRVGLFGDTNIQWGEQVFDTLPILQVLILTKHVEVMQ